MVTGYDEPATGKQLHHIAQLCMACGIREPVEEQPLTVGEAGVIIRRLQNERPHKPKKSQPCQSR